MGTRKFLGPFSKLDVTTGLPPNAGVRGSLTAPSATSFDSEDQSRVERGPWPAYVTGRPRKERGLVPNTQEVLKLGWGPASRQPGRWPLHLHGPVWPEAGDSGEDGADLSSALSPVSAGGRGKAMIDAGTFLRQVTGQSALRSPYL